MSKPRIVYFNPGMLPIQFGATRDLKAFRRELKRLGVRTEIDNCGVASTYTLRTPSSTVVIVTLNRRLARRNLVHVCAHEAYHVAHSAIDAMGGVDDAGEETWAYAVQWATECLYREFARK